MIKKMAWNTFKNTGDVNTFLELKQIENLEEQMRIGQINNNGQQGKKIEYQIDAQMGEQNGNNQNEWYNNI